MKNKYPVAIFVMMFYAVCSLCVVEASEHYWTGSSELSSDFSNSENWDVAPNISGVSNDLIFGISDEYSPYVDQEIRVQSLIITRDSEQSYVFDGSTLVIYNESSSERKISNLGLYELVINNGIRFDRHPWYSANTIFDTGTAGIQWNGEGYFPHTTTFRKEGSGTLHVTGVQDGVASGAGVVSYQLASGRLRFDLNAGATIRSGSNVSMTGSAVFEIQGSSENISLGAIGVGGNNSSGRFVASGDGDMEITASSFSTRSAGSWSTYHIDLSGATVSFITAPNLNWGLITAAIGSTGPEVTVKQGGTTGFATLGGPEGKTLVRYNDYDASTTVGESVVWNSSNNFMTTGGDWTVNTNGFNTLTIRGAGKLTGTSTTGRAILMEEGVMGDYTIDVALGGYFHVHQYSMQGNLILNKLVATGSNNLLVKTGPGTVVVTDAVSANLGRGIYVQQGRLQMNGTILSPGIVSVQYEAVLGGSGSLGGGSSWTGNNRNYVVVSDGGSLDGTNADGADALTIIGSLEMTRDAQYQMTLAADRGNPLTVIKDHPISIPSAVALNGNLALTLDYVPNLNEWIVLLRTDGLIDGEFLSYNNKHFGGSLSDLLTLSYNEQDYGFRIVYDHDLGGGYSAVALQAIPEPSTVALLAGLTLVGVVWMRRQRS